MGPGIDAGWSPGMPGTMFDVPAGLPTDLWSIPDPLHRYQIIEVPESRQMPDPQNKQKVKKMMDF